MRPVINFFITFSSAVVRRLLRLSLRFYLVVISFALCLAPLNLNLYTPIDHALLYISAKLKDIQRGPASIAVVLVPDDEVAQWHEDFYAAGSLSSLLSNVLHSSKARIGILLSQPLNTSSSVLDKQVATAKNTPQSTLQLLEKKRYLRELLNNKRVVLGVKEAYQTGPLALAFPPFDDLDKALHWIEQWSLRCDYCAADSQTQDAWYLAAASDGAAAQIWYDNGSVKHPAFLAELMFRDGQHTKAEAGLPFNVRDNWIPSATEQAIPARRFLAGHSLLEAYSARTISLTMEEAKLISAFPEFVLIGAESNSHFLHKTANTLYSLQKQQTYVLPWWAGIGQRILLIVVLLYICFLHFRLPTITLRISALSCIGAAVIGFSLYSFIAQRFWFPSVAVVLWLAVALVLMHYWYKISQRNRSRRKRFAEAISEACYALEHSEHIPEAVTLLGYHPNRESSVAKICQLSEKLTQKLGSPNLAITLLNATLEITASDKRIKRQLEKYQQAKKTNATLAATRDPNVSAAAPIPKNFGRYKVQRELGRGAVGVVYLGFDPAISREVAIKSLDSRQFSSEQVDNLKTRFFREAEAAGRLNHPNIVSVYDVGEAGNLAYIAMDYVKGNALSDFIGKDNLLPVSTVYRIIYDVAVALSYAHEKQIVHRDIKPGNVMYAEVPYTVKVADFGIARLLDNSKTRTGEILGSPLYMSPEQLKGSKVAATADIFSLGVTFYQLLSGELPFNADNLASLTYEIIHTKHRSVRAVRKDLPASAARIINQCLQKSPTDRYESAAELALVLKKSIKRDFPADAKRFDFV